MLTITEWAQQQYDQAREAARDARSARRDDGRNPRALEHCSAVARMCAFGQLLTRIEGLKTSA